MKALVISGGGSKGAFAGGIAEYLIKEFHREYDIFVGTSTGSLLLTHLAIGKVEKIKSIYTNVCQKDIFNINPFFIKKKNGKYQTSINHFNTLLTFIKGADTFGESENLRKLIHRSFEKEEFEQIKALGKKVFFTVSNISQQRVEYFGSDTCSHELYCDMAWASANFVPFMSLFEHNGNMYADGGFGTHIPISQAIKEGATDIDVIVLDSENEKVSREIRHNPFSILLSTFQFMGRQISLKDRVIGELMSLNRQVDVRLYFTPRKLIENSLIFEPELMREWWQEGIEYARIHEPFCHCHMPGR